MATSYPLHELIVNTEAYILARPINSGAKLAYSTDTEVLFFLDGNKWYEFTDGSTMSASSSSSRSSSHSSQSSSSSSQSSSSSSRSSSSSQSSSSSMTMEAPENLTIELFGVPTNVNDVLMRPNTILADIGGIPQAATLLQRPTFLQGGTRVNESMPLVTKQSNLMHWWRFDESGQFDSSDSIANNGSYATLLNVDTGLAGSPAAVVQGGPGAGNAVKCFVGATTSDTTGFESDLIPDWDGALNTEFSTSFWVKHRNVQEGIYGGLVDDQVYRGSFRSWLSIGPDSGNNAHTMTTFQMGTHPSTAGYIYFVMLSPVQAYSYNVIGPLANAYSAGWKNTDWTNFVVTWEIGAAPLIYMNGALVWTGPDVINEALNTNGPGGDFTLSNGTSVFFGNRHLQGGGVGNQSYADLRIYNTVLNLTDVGNIYNGGQGEYVHALGAGHP